MVKDFNMFYLKLMKYNNIYVFVVLLEFVKENNLEKIFDFGLVFD